MSNKMRKSFIERPLGKFVLINCGVMLGLFIAYRRGSRGSDLLFLGIACFVLLNAIGAMGIWVGRKMGPAKPNRFLKPLWIAVAVLWLIYLLDYLFPNK
jgi:uncharacterized membrane protein YfcA